VPRRDPAGDGVPEAIRRDFVIDLVGYAARPQRRRRAPLHPAVMYQRIDSHLPVRELYAGQLVKEGHLTADEGLPDGG